MRVMKEIGEVGTEQCMEQTHLDVFQEIKPEKKMSVASATSFVRDLFESAGKMDLREKMYMYDESDFNLEFDFDAEVDQSLEAFTPEIWAEMGDEERKESIGKLVDVLNDKFDIGGKTGVTYYRAPLDDCGYYNEQFREIGLNIETFENPKEVLDTIAHEMKHAYQRYRADQGITYMDQLYKYNFEHYVVPLQDKRGNFVNYFAYTNQYVEAEARAFANIFTERMGF